MAELKVCSSFHNWAGQYLLTWKQSKLEAQYTAKREAHTAEINDLKQQLEQKTNDIRLMNNTVETLKGVNDELKVRT